jgi:hypothetical protein
LINSNKAFLNVEIQTKLQKNNNKMAEYCIDEVLEDISIKREIRETLEEIYKVYIEEDPQQQQQQQVTANFDLKIESFDHDLESLNSFSSPEFKMPNLEDFETRTKTRRPHFSPSSAEVDYEDVDLPLGPPPKLKLRKLKKILRGREEELKETPEIDLESATGSVGLSKIIIIDKISDHKLMIFFILHLIFYFY